MIELGIPNPATARAAPVPCPVDPVAGSAAAVHTLRRASATGAEESFVAAPGVVREKRRACFTRAWIEATAPDLFSAAA